MELRQLRYVLAVADELHFGRAASREHITASALSQQIARLERELGVVLFDRTPRRVEVTAAGAVFVERAREVLLGVAGAADAARAAAGAAASRVVVGFTSHGAGPLMARLLQRFRAARPGVSVELRELDFAGHFSALDDRVVDLQFVRLPFGSAAGVRVRPLLTEPRLVAVPAGHRFAAGDPDVAVPAADLAAETWFRLPPSVPAAWAAHFAPWGSTPTAPRISTVGEALSLVATGAGVALLPRSVAAMLPRTDVVYRAAEVEPSRLAVAWRPGDGPDVLAALAIEMVGV